MPLASLSISNLRNIQQANLDFSTGLNLIIGANASGKTTLLEAIQILASTRTFRSRFWQEYVSHGEKEMAVKGKVISGVVNTHLEVSRQAESVSLKINNGKVHKVSDIAVWLPVQLIHPDSHALVSGGPKMRRQFLDWGLFHVKPSFITLWRRYDRALKQRNVLLRKKTIRNTDWKGLVEAWNPELDSTSKALHALREAYIARINQVLPRFIGTIVGKHTFHIEYSPGWNTSEPLSKQLQEKFELDCMRGFTHYGPHRSDLQLLFDDHPAKSVLSRGQQKMLVIALLLAQIEVFNQYTDKELVLLIDDLRAELDQAHCQRLLSILQKMPVQLFITSTDSAILAGIEWPGKKILQIDDGVLSEVL